MARRKTIDRGPRDWAQLNRHRKRAKHQLMIEPLCRFCLAKGVIEPARVADHVVPHKSSWNDFRLGELQSLCWSCHSATKQQIECIGYSTEIGSDGVPIDRKHPVYQLDQSGCVGSKRGLKAKSGRRSAAGGVVRS
jgi:hypothetical protein